MVSFHSRDLDMSKEACLYLVSLCCARFVHKSVIDSWRALSIDTDLLFIRCAGIITQTATYAPHLVKYPKVKTVVESFLQRCMNEAH